MILDLIAHATFVGLDAQAWSAIGTWGLVAVGLGSAVIVIRQVQETRLTREEEARPYVAVFMEDSQESERILELVIRNFGKTAAYDAAVNITPPPRRGKTSGYRDVQYPKSIPTLVPGQEWRTVWDSPDGRDDPEADGQLMPSHYRADVTYYGKRGSRQIEPTSRLCGVVLKFLGQRARHSFSDSYDLDWGIHAGRLITGRTIRTRTVSHVGAGIVSDSVTEIP